MAWSLPLSFSCKYMHAVYLWVNRNLNKPVICSQIGSTEWVEENREMLASRAVAYLNIDSAVHEAGFHAFATPQLDELLKQAAKQVP